MEHQELLYEHYARQVSIMINNTDVHYDDDDDEEKD